MVSTAILTSPDVGKANLNVFAAVIAGLLLAITVGRLVTVATRGDVLSPEPICSVSDGVGPQSLDTVVPIGSYALPNVPGKRVTIVRVTYGPGGFSRPHRHGGSVTAYITKGEVRSQLAGGAIHTFKVGESFFEPPGAVHLISANASETEPAELVAVFVADEGAQLTTYLD